MENKRISYTEKENIAYVTTHENKLIIEKNKTLLKDILVTKNTIDFIFNKMKDIDIRNKKLNWFKTIKVPMVALLIAIAFGTPIFFINSLPMQIVLGIISLKFFAMTGITLKDWVKIKKNMNSSCKMQIDFLEKQCEYELEKLKELESVSKDKEVAINKSVIIPKSERIESLKNKLLLIQNYINNKEKYLELYNFNLLNSLIDFSNYTENDIGFIKYIIEEELKNKEKENHKQKVKK